MIKALLNELKKACFSVLPIYFLILVLCFTPIITLKAFEIVSFSIATAFIIVGIALFNYGVEQAMTPIGKRVGRGLIQQGKIAVLLFVVFVFGFIITITEPDLSVLALQTKSLFSNTLLTVLIAVGVGVFLLLAVLKIIHKTDLLAILSCLYMIAFALVTVICLNDKQALVPLCFDSGGVTTGPMTVPFLIALGAGVANVIAQKSEKDASFGFVAVSSIGPVIVMLAMCLFSGNADVEYQLADYGLSDGFFSSYVYYLLEKMKSVGIAVGLLFVCYLIVDLIFLHSSKDKIKRLTVGIVIVYIGLVLFLSAVDCTYMGIGFTIGSQLAEAGTAYIIIVAFLIGALTVIAEPAIKILTTQVEELTNGTIKKRSMLIALAIGVGTAISLAFLRIVFEFDLLYVIIPGYIICFVLAFFIPKIYTAIAFDAGGVASGPLTSSFILPIAIGLCYTHFNDALMIPSYGFGIVALVALSPLLSIEILGVISKVKKNSERRNKIKEIRKEDDKVLIVFGELK